MKAKDILSLVEKNPDAEIIIQSTPYDDYAIGRCTTVHVYKAGDIIEESGEDFSDCIDVESSKALVDIIVLS